jgi:hypothetical protein
LFSQIAGAWQILAVRFCLAGGGGELLWLPSGCVSVPVFFFVVLNRPCGSWIANDGGPAVDLIFAGSSDPCGSEPARDGGVAVSLIPADARDSCGSWLASDGGRIADHVVLGVHIHCCGNGCLWFRPYGDSLFFKRQKK